MSGIARRLTAGCLALLAPLLFPSQAFAHKLLVEYRIEPGWRVAVESWFETGDSPPDAPVKVIRADGSIMCHGTLDARGLYIFSFNRPEPLRVVVSDGTGHKAEVTIPAEDLAKGLCAEASAVSCCLNPAGPLTAAIVFRDVRAAEKKEGDPFVDRSAPWPFWNVVLGIGVIALLAIVAVAVSRARAEKVSQG